METTDQNSDYTWPSRVQAHIITNPVSSKEASWKKIRERLDEAPKRKNNSWYWLAAAAAILFFVILCFFPESKKGTEPSLTKMPVLLKKQDPVIADTLQAVSNTTVKSTHPGQKNMLPLLKNSLQPAQVKKETVSLLPADTISMVARDIAPAADDLAQRPAPLQSVHINDLLQAEPVPGHITTKGLAVKKMIRLFSIDFTKEQPSKKKAHLSPNEDTIPDNQN